MICEYPWFSSITTTTCAGVGTWASAVWARMAKRKDRTTNMQKSETLRIGGYIGNSWEDLAEIKNSGITCFRILQGATALASSPGRSKTVPGRSLGGALGTQVVAGGAVHNSRILASSRDQDRSIVIFFTTTSFAGRSWRLRGTAVMLFTMSCPSTTSPKIVCLPVSQSVAPTVMKNCEPLVFGPALAMASLPGLSNLCGDPLVSS